MNLIITKLNYEWIRFKKEFKEKNGKGAVKIIICYLILAGTFGYGWDKLIFHPGLHALEYLKVIAQTTKDTNNLINILVSVLGVSALMMGGLWWAIMKIPFWIIDPVAYYLKWDNRKKKDGLMPKGWKRKNQFKNWLLSNRKVEWKQV